MAKTKKAQSNRVQLRVFVAGRDTFINRQIFATREKALSYLDMAVQTHGLFLDRPQEGGVAEGDMKYAVLIPWHHIHEVDIIGYVEWDEVAVGRGG